MWRRTHLRDLRREAGVCLPASGCYIAVGLLAASLTGCAQGTDRTISLGAKVITTQIPIAITSVPQDAAPIAASPDGRRLAFVMHGGPGRASVLVVDTDSQRLLGKLLVPNGGGGTPMFSRDGSVLDLGTDEGYDAWNYATGGRVKIAEGGPRASMESGIRFGGESGWNSDRTIAIEYPHYPLQLGGEARPTKRDPGQVGVSGGRTFEIGGTMRAGFDEYGNAWFGLGKNWTKVDRDGRVTHSSRPKYLTDDQMKARGSMHLAETHAVTKYKKASAHVSCVWLSDDRAVPFTRVVKGKTYKIKEPYQAALVFAGADVIDFGFLPSRNIVYVVCAFAGANGHEAMQTYLVPFLTSKAPKQ